MEKEILIFQDYSYSRKRLMHVLPGVASQLQDKSREGRIALLTEDVHQMAMMLLGSLLTELTVFLLHPATAERKLKELKDKNVPIINEVELVSGDTNVGDISFDLSNAEWVFSTSNTTSSKSHWVKIPAKVLLYKAEKIGEILGIVESDVTCLLSPLCFIQSIWVLLAHLQVNATSILESFSLDLLKRIFDKKRVTTFITVPSIIRTMLEQLDDIGELRLLGVGGDYADRLLIDRLVQKWPGLYFTNIYGCTETSAADLILEPRLLGDNEKQLHSLGRESGFSKVEILNPTTGEKCTSCEDGIIHINGAYVVKEYYGDEQEVVIGDFGFRTGDMAYKDENGFVYYKGRTAGLIKYNGNKMSNIEIEQAFQSLPGIMETAVLGMPDDLYGQIPVCFFSGIGNFSKKNLVKELSLTLEKYKIPKKFYRCESIPHTVSGKVSRNPEDYHIDKYLEIE